MAFTHSGFKLISTNDIYLSTVHNILSNVLSSLSTERDRLKVALEFDNSALNGVTLNNSAVGGLAALPGIRASLNQALQQNQDLRTRLSRIHEAADLSDVSAVSTELIFLLWSYVTSSIYSQCLILFSAIKTYQCIVIIQFILYKCI